MAVEDRWVTLGAYFKVKPGKLEAFEHLADRFDEKTRNESGIRAYGWSFDGEEANCRQLYQNAEGLLEHAANVGALFMEATTIADCTRLAVHAPEEEIAKLREPFAAFNPQYFVMRNSFRR